MTKYRNLSIFVILFGTLAISTSMGMNLVIFPVYMEQRGVSTSLIGTVLSADMVAAIAVSLIFAMYLSKVNYRFWFVASLLVRIPMLGLMTLTDSIALWAVFIFFNGIGTNIFTLLLQTWLNSVPIEKYNGLIFALMGTCVSLGYALGPILYENVAYFHPAFNFISALLALDPQLIIDKGVFWVTTMVSVIASVPLLLIMFAIPKTSQRGNGNLWGAIKVAQLPMIAVGVNGLVMLGVSSFITIYGMRNGLELFDASLMLTAFMVGGIILETPISWLSDIVNRYYILIAAIFISILCAVYLPIIIYNKFQAWTLLFIWGGVVASIYSMCMALIGEIFTGDDIIIANSAYSLMDSMGAGLGMLSIGFAMDFFIYDGFSYVIMFACLLFFAYCLTRYKVV